MSEELNSIVEAEVSEDKAVQREKNRIRKAAQRARDKAAREAEELAEKTKNAKTESEWWEFNRKALKPVELADLQEQDAVIRDVLREMLSTRTPTREFIQVVVDLCEEDGVAHLGPITKEGSGIPADWATHKFWKEPKLLAALQAESEATKTYVRTGLLVCLPDHIVVSFLQSAGWKWNDAAAVVGYKINSREQITYGLS